MARLLSRKCACGHEFEVMEHNGERMISENDSEVMACPKCGAPESEWTVMLGILKGIDLGGGASTGKHYPYRDRALVCAGQCSCGRCNPQGRLIDNAKERAAILKAKGLVAAESKFDWDAENREARDYEERTKARYDALQDRYRNAPEFADHRRLEDMGFYRDQRAKQMREER